MRAAADAFTRGDYQTAAREWLPHAAQGNPEALFQLGQLYRRGLGVKKDIARAEQYYLRAARRGHVLAQGNLGTMLYFKKPKPDPDGAIKWWTAAARNGDPRSQYMLGALYANGNHLPRDLVQAYAWLTLAAANGVVEAGTARTSLARTLDAKTRAAGLARARAIAPRVDFSGLPEPPPNPAAVSAPPSSQPGPTTPSHATPGAASRGAYEVQLGAVDSKQAARDLWARLADAQADILKSHVPIVEPVTRKDIGRTLYRLRIGSFAGHKDASDLCQALTARKVSCFVARRPHP